MNAYRTDYRTGAVDRIPATHYNDRLHVVNGSALSTPYPRDRMFWIVTEDGLAVEVAFSDDYMLWTKRETYVRLDGEPGSWEPDEIVGWTDDAEDAEEAAHLYLVEVGQ